MTVCLPPTSTYAQRKTEGQIVARDPRRGTPELVRFRIVRDTLVEIGEGDGPNAKSIAVAPFVIRYLNQRLNQLDSTTAQREERMEVALDRGRLHLFLNRRVAALALPFAVGLLAVAGGIGTLYYRRRLRHLHQEQETQRIARRYTLAGREEERGRLAREIHDGPIQDLLALRMASGSGDGGEPLVEVVRELRAMTEDLRPPALSDFGFEAGLASFAKRLERQHPPLSVHLALDAGPVELDEFSRLTVFRVAQEALNNAVVHGTARSVQVALTREGDTLKLSVCDDGTGFQLPASWVELGERGHFGVLGMHERAVALGGWLHLESTPGRGTTVTLTAPAALLAEAAGGA